MTLAEIARLMETVRQNIIVWNYHRRQLRKRREEAEKYINEATSAYEEYHKVRKQIKDMKIERRDLENKLKATPMFNIAERRELKGKIASLSEDINERDFEKMELVHGFGKENDSDMASVKTHLSAIKTNIGKMDAQEMDFTNRVDEAKTEFAALKAQAVDLDQDELTDARLALRPQMESAAHDRIKRSIKGDNVSFWNFTYSIADTDELVEEVNMAERRRTERQREACPPFKKPRSRERE